MLGFIVGTAVGLVAHQSDAIFKSLEAGKTPPAWVLMSRYGVGYLTTVGVLTLMADEQSNTRRDVALLALAAGVSVGLGVAGGHLIDYARQ